MAARREREANRRATADSGPDAIARRIARQAQNLSDPLEAELWASHLLGSFWEQRPMLDLDQVSDSAWIYGEPLVSRIAQIGGPGSRTALTAIAGVDAGQLGLFARELVEQLPDEPEHPSPEWLAEVGESEITGAGMMCEDVFDDGRTIFLESRHDSGETHCVGVYVDNNLGVMAKDMLVADPLERVAELVRKRPGEHGEMRFELLDPARAAAEIHAAIDLTEMTIDPPVTEDYAPLRALALLRADSAPGGVVLEGRTELTQAQRDALLDEFHASPEGRGFPIDSEEAFVASLAINCCTDYLDGRPLRWSPVVVEVFMLGWVPRKVLAGPELLQALPGAVDAWVRFVGRKRGIPQWAIETTQAAIHDCRDEMLSTADDPAAGDVGKQLLTAAKTAGVNLTDQDALDTFIAGWNARSVID